MTYKELAAALQEEKKGKDEKVESLEAVIKKKSQKIDDLEFEIRHGEQRTKERKAEQALQKYRDPIIDNLLAATQHIFEATSAIDEAQRIPHIPFEALEKLVEPWEESFDAFLAAAEDFGEAFKNIHVDKGRG
jgi:chromosome segregation ATPase